MCDFIVLLVPFLFSLSFERERESERERGRERERERERGVDCRSVSKICSL